MSLPRSLSFAAALLAAATGLAAQATPRPMTFLDVQQLHQVSGLELSRDGRYALYALSVPDWKEAKRFTDIWLVNTEAGVGSARQLTFTRDKNEATPRWAVDGRFFVFESNRDAGSNLQGDQLFVMRVDGGEANRITDAREGVSSWALSRDGKWLVYRTGRNDQQQLWALPVAGLTGSERPKAEQLTRHATPVQGWSFSRDAARIYFLAPDTVDQDRRARTEKQFTVRIRNEDLPRQHLWAFDLASRQERRLTSDSAYSVGGVVESPDGKWLGFTGTPDDRYKRTVTEQGIHGDLYLLETATGKIERLTNNAEVGEGNLRFSPDGRWLAFTAANDFTYFRDPKVYLRRTADAGGRLRKLGAGWDGPVTIGWWSADGKTIYSTSGVKTSVQVLALDLEADRVRPVLALPAAVSARRDDESGRILISYADPKTPGSQYVVRAEGDLPDRTRWVRLTDPNPQVRDFSLGEAEEISWKSSDGKTVGGVLVKPVNYQRGRRYPLIVSIHGGPASADVLDFDNNAQVYAGHGYAVLLPNYRGSTNYGEQHRLDIVGDYFQKGYEDIITGVDHLIAQGIVHPDSLGAMGWSAGGHWSNWIMTQTNRFKAISSGAGAVNWISMYAQSDVQRNRAEYFARGKLPYDDFEAYWRVSPLRYIKNAKTPTLIHVVDGDPRVPRPQSEELYMALRQLGVPTEFFVYPGSTHGIPDPRNRYVKAYTELMWFEKWIRGKPGWFEWKDLLKTLEDPAAAPQARAAGRN